jgi:hypothetical protein
MCQYDLQIVQNTSYSLFISLTDSSNVPIDLTFLNLESYIKYQYGCTGYLVSLNPQVIVPTSGTISLSLPTSGTTGLPIGISFYDVKLVSGDVSILALAGKVFVNPSVS